MRRLTVLFITLATLVGPAAGWSQYATSQREGVIQALELDRSSVIISGLRYRVPLDAEIEVNGSFGALQLLYKGAKVKFECRVISGTEREIVWLETLPANA
ncbi:MAG: hypothetical protein ACYTHJ_22235, partial [Planctomycetota bacterium]